MQEAKEGESGMIVKSCGVEVYVLPDNATCKLDEEHRSPLDLNCCPIGNEECDDCYYYAEENKNERNTDKK